MQIGSCYAGRIEGRYAREGPFVGGLQLCIPGGGVAYTVQYFGLCEDLFQVLGFQEGGKSGAIFVSLEELFQIATYEARFFAYRRQGHCWLQRVSKFDGGLAILFSVGGDKWTTVSRQG